MLEKVKKRTIQLNRALSLRRTLGPLQHGKLDPCVQWISHDFWRATRTPEGPATLRIVVLVDSIQGTAWGPGADWVLEHLDELVGEHQTEHQFASDHRLVKELCKRFEGLRIPRAKGVFETLLPTIIEQRVTGMEAKRAYRQIVRWLSEPAPGPFAAHGLYLPPLPKAISAQPYWAFHRFGIEKKRADAMRNAAQHSSKLEEVVEMDFVAARRRLMAIAGIGPWTTETTMMFALGDPDSVIVGDYHIHNWICWALANEPRGGDDRMLELLTPFAGQRGFVTRLIMSSGNVPPKYGPRYNPIPIAAL